MIGRRWGPEGSGAGGGNAGVLCDQEIDRMIRALPVPALSEFTRARIAAIPARRNARASGRGVLRLWPAVAALPVAAALAGGLWLGALAGAAALTLPLDVAAAEEALDDLPWLDAVLIAEVL